MISWPYAHLLINHFPVVLSISALAIAMLALILGHRVLWQTAMGALTVAGLFIFPVHFSGDQADQALKDPWFIKPGTIEAHNAAAAWALWVILIAGVFAAYCLWRSLKRPAEPLPRWMKTGVVVAGVLATGTVARTAYLGGKIIHEAPVLELKQAPPDLPPGVAAEPKSPDAH
jgi:uncharacterized membrane protein